MSQISTKLSLPYIQPAQAQKHVTHNEAVELLDMIVQLTILDFDAETPSSSPIEGDAYALGPAPTAAWTGQSGIATWRGGGWLFVTPQAGWRAWGLTAGALRVFDGTNWVAASDVPVLENISGLGINATSDVTNKLSVASDASLFNHNGSGHQVKLNKAATGDTASLLYQSNWSGRAEMGLAGTDDFQIKVSDGAAWFTGMTVVGATGAVRIEEVLQLTPRAAPASGAAGDVYFDSGLGKLRCHDGAVWHNLF